MAASRTTVTWSTLRTGSFGPLPDWFPVLLSHCLKSWHWRRKERHDYRLSLLQREVESRRAAATDRDGTGWQELEKRGCVLETAIQLSRLGDLPNDPHRPR